MFTLVKKNHAKKIGKLLPQPGLAGPVVWGLGLEAAEEVGGINTGSGTTATNEGANQAPRIKGGGPFVSVALLTQRRRQKNV